MKSKLIWLLFPLFSLVWLGGVIHAQEWSGTGANVFLLDEDDNATGNVILQFGSSLAEYFEWDNVNNRFNISDTLRVTGNLEQDGNVFVLDADNAGTGADIDIVANQGTDNDGVIRYNATGKQWEFSNDGGGFQALGGGGGNTPYVAPDLIIVGPDVTQNVSILGTGFTPSSIVELVGFTGTINSTTVVSPTQIDINVTTGATTGVYDVMVSNEGVDNTLWAGGNGEDRFAVELVIGTGVAGTYTESFETGLGGWANSGLDVNWSRDSNGTPSGNTGPSTASAGNFYMFTEASNPNFPGRTFGLETTNFRDATSLSFDYHMFGAAMGVLEVQYLRNGSWNTIDTIAGQQQNTQGAAYLSRTIDLTPYPVESLRFFYTSGNDFTGDCAIDNVSIVSN